MKCDVFEACSDPLFSLVSRRWSQWTSCCSVWTQSKTESFGFGRIRRERSGPWTSRSDPSARRPSSHANTHPRARRPRTDSTLLCSRWDLFCAPDWSSPHTVTTVPGRFSVTCAVNEDVRVVRQASLPCCPGSTAGWGGAEKELLWGGGGGGGWGGGGLRPMIREVHFNKI